MVTTARELCSILGAVAYWSPAVPLPVVLFKPLWLNTKEGIPFTEEMTDRALDFWRKRETLHRMVIAGQLRDLPGYTAECRRLEESWIGMAESLDAGPQEVEERKRIMDLAWEQEEEPSTGP